MTTTTALQALPCPFCGSADLNMDDARDFVSCRNCHTEGPYCSGMGSASSTEAWNRRAALSAAQDAPAEPIDMVLHCPACGLQHIDAPDERTPGWVNEPHRSHLCHGCGHIWRPADVPTNGVAAVTTKGKADSPIAARASQPTPVTQDEAATVPAGDGTAFLCRIWGEDIDHTLTAIVPDWDGVRQFCIDYYTGSADHTDHYGKLTLQTLKEEFDEHEADQRGGAYTEQWEIGGLSIERICDCTPPAPQAAPTAAATVPAWQLERMRHIANGWLELTQNGMQWLKNVRDGVSKADDAIDNMEVCYEITRKVAEAPGLYGAATPPAPTAAQPLYGIVDPDYARAYSIIRCTAWMYGYAVGMHGSFTRDLDLILVPWTDKAVDAEKLLPALADRTGTTVQHGSPSDKPHGRKAWTLLLPGFTECRWIDISVMPRSAPTPQAPALVPLTDHHKLDNDQQVFFYEQDFYVLSNFSAFNLKFNGLTFPTSEHAYHYEKFAYERVGESVNDAFQRRNLAMSIKEAPSAHEAFKLAERWKGYRRADWDAVKVDIMREILRAKASQHEYVRRKLLETGDRELIEDSWRDDYWGWGPNRDGQNMLGKLWMEVRAGLRGITPAGTTPKEQQ